MTHLKKLILLLIIFTLFQFTLNAQKGGNREDQLESLKIAFITKQLRLSPDESKCFWPVFNQYMGEMKALRKSHGQGNDDELVWQEKVLNLKKKYKNDFVKCIGQDKFNQLLNVERDWREFLRKELESRKQ